jgi:hypothetical protein
MARLLTVHYDKADHAGPAGGLYFHGRVISMGGLEAASTFMAPR